MCMTIYCVSGFTLKFGNTKILKSFLVIFPNLLRIELLSTIQYYGFRTCAIENLTNTTISVQAPMVLLYSI